MQTKYLLFTVYCFIACDDVLDKFEQRLKMPRVEKTGLRDINGKKQSLGGK